MSDNQEYTVYEADTNQPVTVINASPDDGSQIQYITQDGTVVSAAQIAASSNNIIQVKDSGTVFALF